MIPDGSIVTYQGVWAPTNTIGASDLISKVSGDLSTNGFSVRSANSDANLMQNSEIPFVLDLGNFHVTLVLQVNNGVGYATPEDVISIVRHWVFQETGGSFPTSDTIPTVQIPGGQSTSTGQPQDTTQQTDPVSKNDPFSQVGGAVAGLVSSLTTILPFLLIGAAVIFFLPEIMAATRRSSS